MTPRSAPYPAWGALLVGVVGAIVFAPSLANGFAYDDVALVASDPRVHSLGQLDAIFGRGYWSDDALGLYRPVTTLSFAIDWSVGSGHPAWFHFTNTLLHAGASVLVFLLLLGWFSFASALAGGLLFAVHPVHVEAVANIVGRAEILAAIGVLGALLLWRRRDPGPIRGTRTIGVATLFAVGIGAKESAIVLLPLLVLADLASGRAELRRPGAWLRDNALVLTTLILVLAAWLAVRIAILGTMAPGRVDAAFDFASEGSARVLTALQAWPVWANLLFVPHTLLADYGPRVLMPVDSMTPLVAAGALLAVALPAVGLATAAVGRTRTALVLLWFPVTILPVSNLLFATGVIVAERTLYLPSVAACLALACAVEFVEQRAGRSDPARRTAAAVLAAVLILLAARSIVRVPVWKSTDSMFAALLHDRPDAFRAQWYLAREARNANDAGVARARYDLAIQLWPFRHRLVLEAAIFAGESGDLNRARDLARQAVVLKPQDLDGIRFLAGVALDLSDTATAGPAIREGLRLHPDDEILQRMRDAFAGLRLESQ